MARASYYGKDNRRSQTGQTSRYGYVDGNTVRRHQSSVRPVPERRRELQEQEQRRKRQSTSKRTRKNRARALQMNLGYVAFLTIASVATLFLCVNYLKLQADNTSLRNAVSSSESRLNELRIENDAAYENALASVDLQQIRDIAINKLGMIYANEDQVRTYSNENSDYVRQYEDVPVE